MNFLATVESLGGADVLGGEVRSETEFVERVEEGLPSGVVARLMELGGLSDAEMAQIIPRRTLSHLKNTRRLSPEQSDRIARAAGVLALAHETFGSREKANGWMRDANRALDGKTPLSMLRTGSGAQLVEQVLTRIAHGVYS